MTIVTERQASVNPLLEAFCPECGSGEAFEFDGSVICPDCIDAMPDEWPSLEQMEADALAGEWGTLGDPDR